MKRKRHSRADILVKVRQANDGLAAGVPLEEIQREQQVSLQTLQRVAARLRWLATREPLSPHAAGTGKPAASQDGGHARSRQEDSVGGHPGKFLSPARRRRCVEFVRTHFALSERRACEILGLPRSTHRYSPRRDAYDEQLLIRLLHRFAARPSPPRLPPLLDATPATGDRRQSQNDVPPVAAAPLEIPQRPLELRAANVLTLRPDESVRLLLGLRRLAELLPGRLHQLFIARGPSSRQMSGGECCTPLAPCRRFRPGASPHPPCPLHWFCEPQACLAAVAHWPVPAQEFFLSAPFALHVLSPRQTCGSLRRGFFSARFFVVGGLRGRRPRGHPGQSGQGQFSKISSTEVTLILHHRSPINFMLVLRERTSGLASRHCKEGTRLRRLDQAAVGICLPTWLCICTSS